jgi:NAD(P)-dependent dehydrogenase (short-subunit alcohol dehydrogenase family)
MTQTIIWISGASQGIGAALSRHVPYHDARIINLDILPCDRLETVQFDLRDPVDWQRIGDHFQAELDRLEGGRAYFLHCAYSPAGKGLVTRTRIADYQQSLIANNAGSLALGAAFIRAVQPGQDTGLMLMSSGAAQHPLIGYSGYGSSKIAIEHWVRIVGREMRHQGWGPWVVATRPALVDTTTARAASVLDATLFPLGGAMAADLDSKSIDPDTAAVRIWSALPPQPKQWLIDIGAENDQP